VVDAVGVDYLIEEVVVACVDGFSEFTECGLCGFFAHVWAPSLMKGSQRGAAETNSVAGKFLYLDGGTGRCGGFSE
jgi:hypothetical protein